MFGGGHVSCIRLVVEGMGEVMEAVEVCTE